MMQVWLSINEEVNGPFSLEEIAQMLQEGRISPNVLAAEEGSDQWMPLSTLIDIRPPPTTPVLQVPLTTTTARLTRPGLPVSQPRSGVTALVVVGFLAAGLIGGAFFVLKKNSDSRAQAQTVPVTEPGDEKTRVRPDDDSLGSTAPARIDTDSREERIAALEKMGTTLMVTRDPFSIMMNAATLNDGDLAILAGFTDLKSLSLSGGEITDAGLAHLKGLNQLENLGLDCPRLTDHGLIHLKGLSNLRCLQIGPGSMFVEGVAWKEGPYRMSHSIVTWTSPSNPDLPKIKITDAGLVHLEGLHNLVGFGFFQCEVTKEGYSRLTEKLGMLQEQRAEAETKAALDIIATSTAADPIHEQINGYWAWDMERMREKFGGAVDKELNDKEASLLFDALEGQSKRDAIHCDDGRIRHLEGEFLIPGALKIISSDPETGTFESQVRWGGRKGFASSPETMEGEVARDSLLFLKKEVNRYSLVFFEFPFARISKAEFEKRMEAAGLNSDAQRSK